VYSLNSEFIVDAVIQKNHCLALNLKGEVFSWGLGIEGALGYQMQDLEAC
jgi:alpha-tubulin suppressor-like RCC1 family protein